MSEVGDWKYVDPARNDAGRKEMLLSNEIRKFRDKGLLISKEFKDENLRPAAYTLRIGNRYVDSRGRPGRLDNRKKTFFVMEPNSIVYVSAHEELDLPFYIAARFNLRVKWVYKGILLGTGPQVEPGYRGYLSSPFTILLTIRFASNICKILRRSTLRGRPICCPEATAEEIKSAVVVGEELDRVRWATEEYLIFKAGSDGRRNTFVNFTRGSLKSQGLSWTLIQAQRDLVELRLRIARQIGSSREVLP